MKKLLGIFLVCGLLPALYGVAYCATPCDLDGDEDVDGLDFATLASGGGGTECTLVNFATFYGRISPYGNWVPVTEDFWDKGDLSVSVYNNHIYLVTGRPPDHPVEARKYDGTEWTVVSTEGLNINGTVSGAIVYDNILHIATQTAEDFADPEGFQIWQFNGSAWAQMDLNGAASGMGNGFGNPYNFDQKGMTINNDCLIVATGRSYTPGGLQVWRYCGAFWENLGFDDGGDNEFIDDVIDYNGRIYLGTFWESGGTEIWSYSDETDWVKEIDGGFDGSGNIHTSSMAVVDNKLFVGTVNYDVAGAQIWTYDSAIWERVYGVGDPNSNSNLAAAVLGYNNFMFCGTYNVDIGGQIYKYDESTWLQINRNGFGTMETLLTIPILGYNNYLYALATAEGEDNIRIWRYLPPIN